MMAVIGRCQHYTLWADGRPICDAVEGADPATDQLDGHEGWVAVRCLRSGRWTRHDAVVLCPAHRDGSAGPLGGTP